MIPSDSIAIDGDTAWLVVKQRPTRNWVREANRPCDTCGGTGMDDDVIDCAHCSGTGRHSFTIEVDCQECDGSGEHDTGQGCWACQSCDGPLSVHVLEVLPIVDETAVVNGYAEMPARCITWLPDRQRLHGPDERYIDLPSNAGPGKWAVHLAIHERNQYK